MKRTRIVLEIGMGTDIRGGDSTKAAVRALRDALWHNSLGVANAIGAGSDDMWVEVHLGVPHPETVDTAQVLAVLPHGSGEVHARSGGLEIRNPDTGDRTLIAHAGAVVWMEVPQPQPQPQPQPEEQPQSGKQPRSLPGANA